MRLASRSTSIGPRRRRPLRPAAPPFVPAASRWLRRLASWRRPLLLPLSLTWRMRRRDGVDRRLPQATTARAVPTASIASPAVRVELRFIGGVAATPVSPARSVAPPPGVAMVLAATPAGGARAPMRAMAATASSLRTIAVSPLAAPRLRPRPRLHGPAKPGAAQRIFAVTAPGRLALQPARQLGGALGAPRSPVTAALSLCPSSGFGPARARSTPPPQAPAPIGGRWQRPRSVPPRAELRAATGRGRPAVVPDVRILPQAATAATSVAIAGLSPRHRLRQAQPRPRPVTGARPLLVSVPLVLRTPSSPSAADGCAATSPASAAGERAGAAPRSAELTLPPLRSAPAARPELDPALVDRLAEDLLTRLEKRLRIERERRGL